MAAGLLTGSSDDQLKFILGYSIIITDKNYLLPELSRSL